MRTEVIVMKTNELLLFMQCIRSSFYSPVTSASCLPVGLLTSAPFVLPYSSHLGNLAWCTFGVEQWLVETVTQRKGAQHPSWFLPTQGETRVKSSPWAVMKNEKPNQTKPVCEWRCMWPCSISPTRIFLFDCCGSKILIYQRLVFWVYTGTCLHALMFKNT